jgi:hypothetical protein
MFAHINLTRSPLKSIDVRAAVVSPVYPPPNLIWNRVIAAGCPNKFESIFRATTMEEKFQAL